MFKFDELGQQIVDELSQLIQEDIILTDKRGFIQASTEPARLNQFHEGAIMSLREKKLLFMTEVEVKKLRGVRKGVCIPIVIEGKPIAVLGITGDPEQIHPQASLIRRVVELFIQDSLKRQEKETKAREFEFFVFDWITSTAIDPRFLERAAILDIQVEQYKQVVILQQVNADEPFKVEDIDYLVAVQKIHPMAKMIRWGQEKILMILPEVNQPFLKSELENMLIYMKRKMKIEVAVGIGEPVDFKELAISYNQAERAAEVSKKMNRIVFEHELRFDLILHALPKETREEFIRRTVAPLEQEEELLHNLRVWFSENQSMQSTANKLHIHKNTLSYRLQKVETLTGLSVSNLHDLLLIYLGVRFIDESNYD